MLFSVGFICLSFKIDVFFSFVMGHFLLGSNWSVTNDITLKNLMGILIPVKII